MSRVIAIANQKGGVGKTTTSINLSASLAVAEKRTLLIDIDPQGNASSGINISADGNSIYNLLVGQIEIFKAISTTQIPSLSIIPADIQLVGAEIELVEIPQREKILRNHINQIRNDYEYIIIDCPPSLGILTLNALTCADSVLIPVQCEYFALEGLGKLLNTINIVKQNFNEALTLEGVLLTMFDTRLKLSQQVADEVRRFFGEKVFETVIHRNVKLSEAPSYGKPIIMYDALSLGAKNYMSLASELLKRNS